MAITEENGGIPATMLVSPSGYGNNGGMFGMGGDWFAWFILVLLIGGNGWGMGGFGGGMMPWLMGGMGGGYGLDYLYPWLNNSQHISDGFRDQQISSQLGDILLGQAGIQQAICQTGNGISGAVRDGFSAAEIAANGRQMANMQTQFALQSQIAQGTSEARLSSYQTQNVIQAEAAASRASGTADTQKILDKLYQLELEGEKNRSAAKDDIIAQLRQELLYARGQASQIDQTARIIQGQSAATGALVNELRSCPIPAQPVYGSTPIFQCQNQGCGCASCGTVR